MKIDFDKSDGLVPVIIQEELSLQVLMLGYMNREAFEQTEKEGRVTFYSRSKQRLWTKGESSGNFLTVKEMTVDCDNDTLLIKVHPEGDTCHKGSYSCFGNRSAKGFIYQLQDVISNRVDGDDAESYTNQLVNRGVGKVAQKVGEEAVELVIESLGDDRELFVNEGADLLYHLLVLLKTKGFTLEDIEQVLLERSKG